MDKLFVGCLLTPQLKFQLEDNMLWKNARLELGKEALQITRFEGKEYIGRQLPHLEIPWNELKELENAIRKSLLEYCPEIMVESLKIWVFPLVLIG